MNKDQCLHQWDHIREEFAKAFDHSLIQSYCTQHEIFVPQNLRRLEFASGRQFSCIKLPRNGFNMDLALKIFHRDPIADIYFRNLKTCLEKLRAIPTPNLIPPMETMMISKRCVLVMPFGPQSEDSANTAWHPLADWKKKLVQDLQTIRLEIDDVLQIRSWRGVPFLVDFSDLKTLNI